MWAVLLNDSYFEYAIHLIETVDNVLSERVVGVNNTVCVCTAALVSQVTDVNACVTETPVNLDSMPGMFL